MPLISIRPACSTSECVFPWILLYHMAPRTCFTASSPGWPCVTDCLLSYPPGQTEPHLSKTSVEAFAWALFHKLSLEFTQTSCEAFSALHSEPNHLSLAANRLIADWHLFATSQMHRKVEQTGACILLIWLRSHGTRIS